MSNWYVTQTGGGLANGTLGNPWAVTGYNASSSTGPGDIIYLSGTITSPISVPNGGAAGNPITIIFAPGANMTAPVWSAASGGAISIFEKNYVTIDGGASPGMGGPIGNTGLVNGRIRCTANGTNLANQTDAVGINGNSSAGLLIKNLWVGPMYVRTGTIDETPGSMTNACISNTASDLDISGYSVTNCVMQDAFQGILSDYSTGGNYTFSYNTIFNCNWGGNCSDRGPGCYMKGLIVHDNLIYNFANWSDTVNNNYHHNGFYAWAESNGALVNPIFYNNVIGPGFGGVYQTAGIFVSCQNGLISGATFYNNIFICNSGEFVGNDLITVGGNGLMGSINFWNNTFFMGGSGTAFGAGNGQGNAVNGITGSYIMNAFNNLGISGGVFITAVKTGAATNNINNNLGYGFSPNAGYGYTSGYNGGNGVYYSFAQWTGFGFDLNSPTGNPLLTSNYNLTAGSPAIGSGTNLSSFFTTDAAGNPRPASPIPWDIGAYQFLVYRLKRLGAHLKMYGYST